jgi:hypothetical protein
MRKEAKVRCDNNPSAMQMQYSQGYLPVINKSQQTSAKKIASE